jgi:hypothetical protein
MEQIVKNMKKVIFLLAVLSFGLIASAQDCSRYKVYDVKDTMILNNYYVYFKMSIDTTMQQNTGYTDMYFVDANLDTLNEYGTWSQYIPDPTPNNGFGITGTVEYLLALKTGMTNFPIPFSGHLVIRNPNCEVPVSFWPTSVLDINGNAFSVYPNPAKNHITIQTGSEEEFQVLLYTVSGQVVYNCLMHQGNIDVSAIQSGLYFLLVKHKGNSFVQKILID